MSWRRIADYLIKRGYQRRLCNLSPSLVKITTHWDEVDGVRLASETGVEHVVDLCDIMDACVMGRWDTIASMLKLGPIEILALMEPEE